MNEEEFKARTKRFTVLIVRLVGRLPKTIAAQVIGRQLVRAAGSVGANYRAVCRAKSVPDMLAKLAIVEEEADESQFWLEVLVDSEILDVSDVSLVLQEANEIVAMIVASMKTLRKRL